MTRNTFAPRGSGAGTRPPRHPGTWLGIVVSTVLLASCASTLPPASFADGTPAFEPERFFRGVTRSSGLLENRSGEPTRRLKVEGAGQLMPDGTLRLDQWVALGDDAPRMRTWSLRRVDAHRYAATLTDASGPVEAEAHGNLFHLTYATRTPPFGRMEQWMYLQPDGRTVVNEATITVLGFVVAHVSERITQADDR